MTLLLGTQLIGVAHAAIIEVTSTADDRGAFSELQCLPPGSDVDAGPGATTVTGGATLAEAQADGRVTLREAICVANNTPEAVIIVLSPSTYTLKTADNYWYGPNGLPPISNDITIEGNGAVIERDPANSRFVLNQRFRLFFISRKTLTDGIAIVGDVDRAKLTLRDLTLRNGLAQGGEGQAGGAGAGMGGAIFNQGQLVLSRVTLNGNVARGGDSGVFSVVFGGVLFSGVGAGMGRDATDGGGFGPGQFGGAFGGSALFEEAATPKHGCGGGAGFGVASGGDAFTELLDIGLFFVGGAGGGLGRVGGAFFCSGSRVCAGEGDGGAGGVGREDSTPLDGDGRGGSFGLNGSRATGCGGGGGVGAGGAPGSAFDGFKGGAGGFGGGGAAGAATVGTGGTLAATLGGSGGFGGGGGSSWEPESGGNLPPPGLGGFGGGNGGYAFELASGGGGAGMGGALFNYGGDVTASNTTWTDNHAIGGSVQEKNIASPGAGYGGAIFNLDGILNIAYSTLSDNRVVRGAGSTPALPNPAGGAIYNRLQNPGAYGFRPELVIRTSILANSLDGDGLPISDCNVSLYPDVDLNAVILITGLSVFQKLEIVADLDDNDHLKCLALNGSIEAAPQLLPLADNGGLTPTMAIGAGSPAIDLAGNCGDSSTDQRGVARPQGAACDAGAFELVPGPAVGLDLSAIDFPSVRVGGSSGTQNVTITNTGTADLILGSLTISGSQASEFGIDVDNCSGQTLAVNADCTVGIEFSPAAKDTRSAQLNIPSNAASSPDSVSLSGTGIQSEVSISLSPADFGEVRVGETSLPLTVTLTNNGSATLSVSALTAAAAPFAQASAGTCGAVPFSVNAGSSCTLPYTFSPTADGPATQSFTVTSDAESGSGMFELSGTGGQSEVSISLSPPDFGEVRVGETSDPLTVTISNTGTATKNVSALTAAAAPFAQTDAGTCGAVPFSVDAGTSCTLTYTFSPTTTGEASQGFTVTSDAESGSGTFELAGTGVQSEVSISLSPPDFGEVRVGETSDALTVTINNTGTATKNVSALTAAAAPFAQTDEGTCGAVPFSVDAGTSCTLTYTFSPTEAVEATQAFNLNSDAESGSGTFELAGTGTEPVLSLDLSALNFGLLPPGESAQQRFTITNNGTDDLNLFEITDPGPPFAVVVGEALGDIQPCTMPSVLEPGESCLVTVEFAPQSARGGSFEASLEIRSDAANSPITVTLRASAEAVPIPIFGRNGLLLLILGMLLAGFLALRPEPLAKLRG